MYPEAIPENPKTTTLVAVKYDCCGRDHVLKWKDADKNFKKNQGKHICRPCWLKNNNPARREEVQAKMKATCLEKYGTTCALNTPENIESRNEKMFGSEEAVDAIVEKRRQTSLERYGTEAPMQNDEIKERQQQVLLKRYGVRVPLKSPEIREKAKQTCQERYGCDNVSQVPEIRAKTTSTLLERYGVEHYNQLPEMKEYLRENCTQWLAESYANPWAKGITRPEEWNDKQRETVMALIDDGEWNAGPKYSIKGKYASKKCRRREPMFRSSYELKTHWHLDNNDEVEWYDYEPFRVAYYDSDGKKRYYVVDFIVKKKDDDKLFAIEVKNDYTKQRFIDCGKKSAFEEQCGDEMTLFVWSNEEINNLELDLELLFDSPLVSLFN